MTDTTELRRMAEAAAPGPWTVENTGPNNNMPVIFDEKWRVVADICGRARMENAAYIAAANPQAILALLDRLERAETLVAQCRATLEAMHPSAGVPDGDVARIYNGMMEALGDG